MVLCPHVFQGSPGATSIVEEGSPPAIKLIGGYNFANNYKIKNPKILVWGRYVPGDDNVWRNYTPDDFYDIFMRPQITHPDNQGVDAWEDGLNEDFRKKDGTEIPDYDDMMNRGRYEARLAARIAADGKRPIVGQFSVGTPSGTYEQQKEAWRAYQDAIIAAKKYGGYVSLHAYGNVGGWEGPIRSLLAVMSELSISVPILIGECGNEPGWKAAGIAPDVYANQLIAYDNILRANFPQVVAAAIFASGNTPDKWQDYNIDDPVITAALVQHGKDTPFMSNATGFDISHYQGNVDFLKAKQAGIKFAFVKCTEGTVVDSTFATYWAQAKAQNLLRGPYHFFRFSVDVTQQANAFANAIKNDLGELRPVVDIEDTATTPTVSPAIVLSFLQKVEQLTGRKPMIYTAAWYWNNTRFGGPVSWAKTYDLWVANYSLTATSPYLPTDWTTWQFWQYTSQASGPAYGASSAALDLDRFNGDYAALQAYSAAIVNSGEHPLVIESAAPTMPFSFFFKGRMPLYVQNGGIFTYSRTLNVNWKVDVTTEIASTGGQVYWKVTATEWMKQLQLCAK